MLKLPNVSGSAQDKITNELVLAVVGEERSLLDSIRKRESKRIGHILRHDNLLRDVIERRVDGKRVKLKTEKNGGRYGGPVYTTENQRW